MMLGNVDSTCLVFSGVENSVEFAWPFVQHLTKKLYSKTLKPFDIEIRQNFAFGLEQSLYLG